MSQGYLKRNVFERLYTTQTVASSRKQETAAETISKPSTKSKNSAEINPNSRLFVSTEAYKHKHDGDPSIAVEKPVPSRRLPIQRQKRTGVPPASRRSPQKANAELAKTPTTTKTPKASPPKSVPRSSNKTQPQTPHELASPQTPATALTSTPNTVQSTPSHSSLHGDATLPTLDDLVDMIEIPIDEKIASLFSSINSTDGKGALSDIVHELEDRYPDLCTPTAVQNYQQCSDSQTEELDLADFKYFLLFLVYFHILYDDFVFIDDDDLRISKGEFEPVAERLNLFDDLDAAFAEMEQEHKGYIMFDTLCAKCARNKLI